MTSALGWPAHRGGHLSFAYETTTLTGLACLVSDCYRPCGVSARVLGEMPTGDRHGLPSKQHDAMRERRTDQAGKLLARRQCKPIQLCPRFSQPGGDIPFSEFVAEPLHGFCFTRLLHVVRLDSADALPRKHVAKPTGHGANVGGGASKNLPCG